MKSTIPTYVLITAAKNEEDFIEKTIKSVINQTILPQKWIIVSDGSTDKTNEIVEKFLSKNKFIQLIKKDGDKARNFGSKARAVRLAYELIKNLDFEYIGNLDADVSFDPEYYENILNEFEKDLNLGVSGGIRYDLINGEFRKLKCAPDSVGGPFQLFRRKCYDDIGGYIPLRFGGIDAVAETTARMKGWKVKHFPEYKIYHYRQTGSANNNIIRQRFRAGLRNYSIGYHPIFQILKLLNTIFEPPILIGGFFISMGYSWGAIKRYEMPLSDEFKVYLRSEQLNKIKSSLGIKQSKIIHTYKHK